MYITIGIEGAVAKISLAALMPSASGILKSIRIKSGCKSDIFVTTSRPSVAAPQISHSGRIANAVLSAVRINSRSSAIKILAVKSLDAFEHASLNTLKMLGAGATKGNTGKSLVLRHECLVAYQTHSPANL